MNKLLIISGVVLILLVILYILLVKLVNHDAKDMKLISDTVYDLSTKNRLIDSDTARDKFLSSTGGTILSYVYLEPADRTKQVANAKDATLIEQGGAWSIKIAYNGVPTFKINTLNGIETVQLPVIPYQKWTALTIVREGRRFDIYYNGELVASKRPSAYVRIELASISAGSANMRGKITNIYIAGRSYNKSDIAQIYTNTSDTRGKPYVTEKIVPKLGCPSGLFCSIVSTPPENPYKRWQTQYS